MMQAVNEYTGEIIYARTGEEMDYLLSHTEQGQRWYVYRDCIPSIAYIYDTPEEE